MVAEHGTPPAGKGDQPPERELRVALAMRGGVSLAVWIGGALAELDLVRRAMAGDVHWPDERTDAGDGKRPLSSRERATRYAALLRAYGYTSIRFDVLAGASAGGLNAVVYGFAQAIGTDLEWLLGVWEKRGDIWELFHDSWNLEAPFRTEAVLDADRHFYAPLRQALLDEGRSASGAPARGTIRSDYLTIDLSATLQSGPPLPDLRTGADLRPRAAHFRFKHSQGSPASVRDDLPQTIPSGDALTPDIDERVRRLAYAARSTSSFPGAFEPAAVRSWPGDLPPDTSDPDNLPSDMAGVFSEVSDSPDIQFDVMDGGVFDNIPISRAVHAIADAPADLPTRRILIYLDPTPPRARTSRQPTPIREEGKPRVLRARFFTSVAKALAYLVVAESSTDDLRELENLRARRRGERDRMDHFLRNEAPQLLAPQEAGEVQPRRGHLRFLERVLLRPSGGPPPPTASRPPRPVPPGPAEPYLRFRAEADAQRVTALLVEPGWGFLHTTVDSPELAGVLSVEDGAQVRRRLTDHLLARAPGEVARQPGVGWSIQVSRKRDADAGYNPVADASALVEAASLMIAFVRQLQQPQITGQPRPGATPGPEALRTAKAALYGIRERAQLLRDERDKTAVRAVLGPRTAPGDSPGPDEPSKDWADVQAETLAAVLWPTPAPTPGEAAALWAELAGIVHTLRQGGAPQSEAGTAQLVSYLQEQAMRAGVELGTIEDYGVPDFFVVGGDEAPLRPDMWQVVEVAETLRLEELVKDPDRSPAEGEPMRQPWRPGTVVADAKLAGSSLFNFGGFLSTDARRHDWEWGRADAAAAFIRILGQLSAEDGLPVDAERGAAAEQGAREAAMCLYRSLDTVPTRPSDLSPARTYPIVARLGLGIQRALWPWTPRRFRARSDSAGRPTRIVTALLLATLRPVLVVLPLVVRPGILAAMLLTASIVLHLDVASHPGTLTAPAAGSLRFITWLALVLAVIGLGLRWSRFLTWSRVKDAEEVRHRRELVAGASKDQIETEANVLTRNWRGARRSLGWGMVLVVVTAVFVLGLVPTGRVEPPAAIAAALSLLWGMTWFDALVVLAAVAALGLRRYRARIEAGGGGNEREQGPGRTAAAVLPLVAVALPLLLFLPWPSGLVPAEVRIAFGWAWVAGWTVWFIHDAWSPPAWGAFTGLTGALATFVAMLVEPRAGIVAPPGTTTEPAAPVPSDVWELLALWWTYLAPWVVAPLVATGGTIVVVHLLSLVLSAKAQTAVAAPLPAGRLAVYLLAMVAWGVFVTFLLRASWGWFWQVPAGLAAGLVVSALTTLVMPFRRAEGIPTK